MPRDVKKNYDDPHAPFKVKPHTFNQPQSKEETLATPTKTLSPPRSVSGSVSTPTTAPAPKTEPSLAPRPEPKRAPSPLPSEDKRGPVPTPPIAPTTAPFVVPAPSLPTKEENANVSQKSSEPRQKESRSSYPIDPISTSKPENEAQTLTKTISKSKGKSEIGQSVEKPRKEEDTIIDTNNATKPGIDTKPDQLGNKTQEAVHQISTHQSHSKINQENEIKIKDVQKTNGSSGINASQRHEVKKILQNKSSIMEKASQRASALNLTRLCPALVFATGTSTLRSVRLQELNIGLVILAATAEDLADGKAAPNLEGVASKQIIIDENRDNDKQIATYLHDAADWIHNSKSGVAMVHAPEGGAFKKGASLADSRRGEGFASALCAAYLVKYQGQSAQEALDGIK